LPLTSYVLFLHSRIRDRNVPRKEFVFYSQRLIRILLEDALGMLTYDKKDVVTPTDTRFTGLELSPSSKDICAVCILRAATSMVEVFRTIVRDLPVGNLLIQRDESTPEKTAKLFYSKLPRDIENRRVFLLDPMLATGGSAIAAVRALQERNVPLSSIIFVNVVSCPEGLRALLKAYPGVRILTSMIDDHLNQDKYIVPGLGDFGDLYFGTM